MEQYHSKKSSIRGNNAVVYETLDRGNLSAISRAKLPHKSSITSTRRMFTFVGSEGRHRVNPTNVKPHTPSKPASPKTRTPRSKRAPRSPSQSTFKSKRAPRSRSQSTLKTNLLSSVQQSTVKKDRSRSASQNSHRETASNVPKSKPVTPIPVEIPAPLNGAASPAVLVDDQPKIEVKEQTDSLIVPSASSSDEVPEEEYEEVSVSPSIVGYRKLVYDEPENKWVEYWKIEEDARRAQKKEKTQKLLEKLNVQKAKPKIHPVKGKITAKMQVMFPTAIVKQDKRHGQYYQNILMTDPLRIELYKRRAPIVPTFYQEHIVKYGKLPFRNNPRPHPVV